MGTTTARDLYDLMGVAPNADESTIRTAYRGLVKIYHPDVGQGSSVEKFHQVQRAYEILIDPIRRGKYDQFRRNFADKHNAIRHEAKSNIKHEPAEPAPPTRSQTTEKPAGAKCPACKEDVPENSKFCNSCGVRLNAPAPEPSPEKQAEQPPKQPSPARDPKPAPRKPQGPPTRAERLQLSMKRILDAPNLPAFSHHIHMIMGLLEDDEVSLRRLTNIVLNDYGLSTTLMRTANSFYYNRSGKPIRSVTHAIALLGIDAIRSLAGSLIFLEHFRKKSVGLAELLLLSNLTANHARHMAKRFSYGRIEEAHLCGMFRNLGEILIACFFSDDYTKILARMKERNLNESEACLGIIGFTYDELGEAMTRHWKLPDTVIGTIKSGQHDEPDKELLHNLTDFSHSLTTAVYRGDPETAKQKIELLIEKHKKTLGFDRNKVGELLDAAIKDTKDTFTILRIPLDDLRLQRQTDVALSRVASEEDAPISSATSTPTPERLMEELENEVRSGLAQDPNMALNQAILMTLEAIFRGGPFDRVLLCLVTQDRKFIRGRLGLGDEIDKLAELFQVPNSRNGDPLISALISREDLFVPPNQILDFGQSNILNIFKPACFGLFPIVVSDRLVGGIYFDRTDPIPLADPGVLAVVSRLRTLAATAIERSRKESK